MFSPKTHNIELFTIDLVTVSTIHECKPMHLWLLAGVGGTFIDKGRGVQLQGCMSLQRYNNKKVSGEFSAPCQRVFLFCRRFAGDATLCPAHRGYCATSMREEIFVAATWMQLYLCWSEHCACSPHMTDLAHLDMQNCKNYEITTK